MREKLLEVVRQEMHRPAPVDSEDPPGTLPPLAMRLLAASNFKSPEEYCQRMATWGESSDQWGGNLEVEILVAHLYTKWCIATLSWEREHVGYRVWHVAGSPSSCARLVLVAWLGTHYVLVQPLEDHASDCLAMVRNAARSAR